VRQVARAALVVGLDFFSFLWGSITGSGLGSLLGWDHRWVIISVVYLLVRCLLGCLMVLTRGEVPKDVELLVLRHENAVLRRPKAPAPLARGSEWRRGPRIVGEHLDRLGQHVAAAVAEQQEDKVRVALGEVERGLLVHKRALSEL
jgi:hypothetical protein